MFIADEDVDLVIVDFTLNDRASGDKSRSPEFDTSDRWLTGSYAYSTVYISNHCVPVCAHVCAAASALQDTLHMSMFL